jgi:putative ABC transport system permease protein
MYARTAAGEAVIGSENLASAHNLHVGDIIELQSPGGVLRLPLAGIVREYSDQQGSIMIDLTKYRQHWNDDGIDFFRVYLAPGTDAGAVREAILTRFAGERRLFVLSAPEVREYVTGLASQWFSMTWLQIAVAILVAVLGIVNSLTVTIADRRRELGVLQAVGGLRSQVRRTIWMEAVTVGLVSLVLGLALGAVHLYFVLEISYRDYPGLRFDYMYPFTIALMLVPVLVVAAFAAALGPAEAAVRGSLVEALEYE